MKVNNDNNSVGGVGGVERGKQSTPETPVPAPARTDKVTLEETQGVAQAVETAKLKANSERNVRLLELEEQVRKGTYKPSPSLTVEEILSAADIEQGLKDMIG